MPIRTQPFRGVVRDIVGTILPCSEYLVLRFCNPLSWSSSIEQCWSISNHIRNTNIIYRFWRVGFPEEILSDRETQFMLGVMSEVNRILPHPLAKLSIAGSFRDREVACSTSDRQVFNFESCVWRAVPSHSSHHPQGVLLAQFSLYVHKSGLKPDSFPP